MFFSRPAHVCVTISYQICVWVKGTVHLVTLVLVSTYVYNTIVCVVTAALERTVYPFILNSHIVELV